MVCHDGSRHLRLCLDAMEAYTGGVDYEIIVVDNASTDDTPHVLASRAAKGLVRALPLPHNVGFPAAVNAGAAVARGATLVICNHDVVVTPGWLGGLLAHLGRAGVGIVGPTTNDSGDDAAVAVSYADLDGLLGAAAVRARAFRGRARTVDKVALFCAAIPRALFDACGGLDEGYGLGMFEDDDLCAAVRDRGLRVCVAEDVFVHHAAGVAFRMLRPRDYVAQFEVNRLRFERKWNVRWTAPGTPR